MQTNWPRAWGEPLVSAVIRSRPENFVVREQLGFELTGEGEHVFLHLEKRQLNTLELQERLASFSGIPARDIGFCGMKDRNAVTQQWFSVGMKGKPGLQWSDLETAGDVKVLEVSRHLRKLKRGVHKANRFELRLTGLHGDIEGLESRLQRVAEQGVPNYFGPQRFGRGGQTLQQARAWAGTSGRKLTRKKRGLFLSALRSFLFNELLAARVSAQSWNRLAEGEVCMLQGSRSRFNSTGCDEDLLRRCEQGDIHPGLPLWGKGLQEVGVNRIAEQLAQLGDDAAICDFLEREGLELSYRAARLIADDFCWRFCDDNSLQLDFSLPPGAYATAVLAELVNYTEGEVRSGNGIE